MTEFLSTDEIIELTGKKRPSNQIKWLSNKGWIFETSATGRPVICREYVRFKLGASSQKPMVGKQPNFGALA
jgi:hypothetical protein